LTLDGRLPFDSPPHVYAQAQTYTVKARAPGRGCLGEVSKAFAIQKAGFSRFAAGAAGASTTIAQAMAPRITTVIALAVQPGGGVIVKGERFGSERPTVQLVGAFPGSPIPVVVDKWGDTFVSGIFPAGVAAVVDHAVKLEVVRARDGWPSNAWPLISPMTAGEIVTIPLPIDAGRVIGCSRAGRGTPSCYIGSGGINGIHTASYGAGGLFADTTGTDEFEIDLKNGWVIASHRAQGLQKGLDGAVEGLDAAVNSSYARLKVRWFAPNPQGGDQASYSIAIWIRGPKDEPYR